MVTHAADQTWPPATAVETPATPRPGAAPGLVTAGGQQLHKGREGEADRRAGTLSVREAARVLRPPARPTT